MNKSLLLAVFTFLAGLGVGYLSFHKPDYGAKEREIGEMDISNFAIWKCKGDIVDSTAQICVDSAYQMVQGFSGIDLNNQPNTRTIWFSFERIENLYKRLKYDRDTMKYGTDGIRIYFAKYPKEYAPGHAHPHAGQNTILFVSTKDSLQKKYHRDYYTQSPRPIPLTPENKGELCPPGDCPGNGALLLAPVTPASLTKR
ncbi:hypothetical protein [Pedobacter duraquae]|uniref:Uncharacterized protein n=1 Tax=Pedobacter duraquae TaxID=425511 RepID=A0A4R6IP24_9SPHI|nr:hypothetical protein [Pedobacter duraquae]TDO23881.1 hypothetical protein CLV32_0167 [Pedobacter duraquae]